MQGHLRILTDLEQVQQWSLAKPYFTPCRAKAARKAREAGQSEKRRKMREDLEKREGAWHSARSEEQKARSKLQVGWAYSSHHGCTLDT